MIPGSMEQLSGLAKISDFDRNVSSMALWSFGGGGSPLVGGFVFSALGVDRFRSRMVSEHQALGVLEEVGALV